MDISKNFACVDHASAVSGGPVVQVPVQNHSNIPPSIDIHWPESAPEVSSLKKELNHAWKQIEALSQRLGQLEGQVAMKDDLRVDVKVLPVEMPAVRVELPDWLKASEPRPSPLTVTVLTKQTPVGVAMAVAPFLYILGWVLYATLASY
jgi:hypothetical protein